MLGICYLERCSAPSELLVSIDLNVHTGMKADHEYSALPVASLGAVRYLTISS